MRLLAMVSAAALLCCISCKREAAAATCPPGALGPAAWDLGLLVLGELHGTLEAPAVALATACAAAQASGGAWLGLEFPRDEQPRIDRFLDDGNAAALLASPWWSRSQQDGRTSEAMFRMLTQIRELRQGGVPLQVVAFDVADGSAPNRDVEMADVIAQRLAQAAHPGIVLVGNIHATRKLQLPIPMARHLTQRKLEFRTLDMATPAGSAWLCGQACGSESLGAMGPGGERPRGAFTLEPTPRGHDGWWFAGSMTASPPAISVVGK